MCIRDRRNPAVRHGKERIWPHLQQIEADGERSCHRVGLGDPQRLTLPVAMGKQAAERLHRPGLGRRCQRQACQQRQQACESVVALLRRGCLLYTSLLFRKKNIITSSTRQGLSDLLINIILPCNIVASFDMQLSGEIWVMVSEILIISLCVQLFVWGLSKVLYRRVPHGPREVLQYGTITSNSGFLGNPMAEGIFGEMGLLYASVAMLPIRVIMWSAGVSLYTRTSGKAVLKKLITHPCICLLYTSMTSAPNSAMGTTRTTSVAHCVAVSAKAGRLSSTV